MLPDYVWGNGNVAEVSQRAAEEMMATGHAAQKIGAAVVAGFTGSTLWSYACGAYAPTAEIIATGLRAFIRKWNPILDVYRDCGVKFAAAVAPGQVAFDLYTAEMALESIGGREEFGFLLDPSQLHWQGVDPSEFVRLFPDRIYHVHITDASLALNGRNGLLGSYLPPGDSRRGWNYRSPGRGAWIGKDLCGRSTRLGTTGRSPWPGPTATWTATSAPRTLAGLFAASTSKLRPPRRKPPFRIGDPLGMARTLRS